MNNLRHEGDWSPECLIIGPQAQHTSTVIFLHGLGDEAKSLVLSLGTLIRNPKLAGTKFIFPTAPMMEVSANGGRYMNSWFDIYSFDFVNRPEDERGLYTAVGWINDIISRELGESPSVPSTRIVVGGLSQGGAVSILTALTSARRLAGLFALSSYIPLRSKASEIANALFKSTPIFWGHGGKDEHVTVGFTKGTVGAFAKQLGIEVVEVPNEYTAEDSTMQGPATGGLKFHTYPELAHWMSEKELKDLADWIAEVVITD